MKRKVIPVLMLIASLLLAGCGGVNAAQGPTESAPRQEASPPAPSVEMSASPTLEEDHLLEENFIPNPFVTLAELEEEYGYDLQKLFPDFEVSETSEDNVKGYRFDLPDQETYLLVDDTQTKLSVVCGDRSAVFSIPRIFPTAVDAPVTLFVRDVTGDGTDELVYLSQFAGTGQVASFSCIVDLATLKEYPVDYEASISNMLNQVTVIPRKLDGSMAICDVALSNTAPISAEIDCKTPPALNAEAEVFAGDVVSLGWDGEGQGMILDVGLSIPEGACAQYLCSVNSPLTFNSAVGTFAAQGPYRLRK